MNVEDSATTVSMNGEKPSAALSVNVTMLVSKAMV